MRVISSVLAVIALVAGGLLLSRGGQLQGRFQSLPTTSPIERQTSSTRQSITPLPPEYPRSEVPVSFSTQPVASDVKSKIGGPYTDSNGFNVSNYQPLTRGEFINALVVALNPKDIWSYSNTGINKCQFGIDVPLTHTYAIAYCYAAKRNIIPTDVMINGKYSLDTPLSRKDTVFLMFSAFIQWKNFIDPITNTYKFDLLHNPSFYADIPMPTPLDGLDDKNTKGYTPEQIQQSTPSYLYSFVQVLTISKVIDHYSASASPAALFYPNSALTRDDAKIWLQRAKTKIPKSLWVK